MTRRFGRLDHELFILDDLTVYVRAEVGSLALEFYPVHFDESGAILLLFVESPIEVDELTFTSIADVVPKLDSLLDSA